MKKIILFSAVAIFIMVHTACQRTLNIDFSNEKPLIVMNGIIEADKPIEISVSKSFSFLNTDSAAPYLKDVSLELRINNKFVEKMQLASIDTLSRPRRGSSHFRSVAHAKVGDLVRIEAKAPGLEPAWAETIIPTPPTIGKVDTTTFLVMTQSSGNSNGYTGYGGYDGFIGYYYNFPKEISFEPFFRMMRLHIDVQKVENNNPQYFLLSLLAIEPTNPAGYDYFPRPLYVNTQDDPIFANNPKTSIFDALFEKNNRFSGSSFFADNIFKNNAYTLNVTTTGYYSVVINFEKEGDNITTTKYKSHEVQNPPMEIRISAVSADWYAYMKSSEGSFYDNEGVGFISEPKVTNTNVHNGIGFISSMAHAYKRIEIPPFDGKDNEIPR